MNHFQTLTDQWYDEAILLRKYGDERGATTCELHAQELELAWHVWQNQPLTIAEAATESGYSEEHLRRMVRSAQIPTAGRPNAPRVRREDVPKKPGRSAAKRGAQLPSNGYNVNEDARDIAKQIGRS